MNGLRLLNTRHYVQEKRNVPIVHLDLNEASAVTVSRRISPFEAGGNAAESAFAMIDSMDLDPTTGLLHTMLSRSGNRGALPTEPTLKLLSHTVRVSSAAMSFVTSAESYCRLAYGYYPDLDVRLNGHNADYFCTADGFIGLRIPAGEHTIEISGRLSPLRRALFVVNVLLLFAAIYWVYRQQGFLTRSLS